MQTPGRVLRMEMFASPEKGFDMPSYARALADLDAFTPSRPRKRSRRVYMRRLIYIDEEATVGLDTSSDHTSCEDSCSDSSPSS